MLYLVAQTDLAIHASQEQLEILHLYPILLVHLSNLEMSRMTQNACANLEDSKHDKFCPKTILSNGYEYL